MYFVTLGEFQIHSLRNSDEDWANNAQLLMLLLRGQTNSKT